MGSVNSATIVGRVGKDPTIRSLQGGDRVASFSVATSESWKDKASGEKRERTTWHNVVCFNQPLIKVIEQYVSKGSQIYVCAPMETRKWQHSDGSDRYSTEIVLRPYRGELVLLDSKPKGESFEGGKRQPQGPHGERYADFGRHDDNPFLG